MSNPQAPTEHEHTYEIIVNAREKTVNSNALSFDQVVQLAFNPVPTGPNIYFTVAYRKAADHKAAGTLVEGETVEIKNGTVFNVSQTDKS